MSAWLSKRQDNPLWSSQPEGLDTLLSSFNRLDQLPGQERPYKEEEIINVPTRPRVYSPSGVPPNYTNAIDRLRSIPPPPEMVHFPLCPTGVTLMYPLTPPPMIHRDGSNYTGRFRIWRS